MSSPNGVSLSFLGPLELVVDGKTVHPGGPNQRALLCYLVLHAGQPISVAALIEAVWGDDAPHGAIRSLRTYVSNLRQMLGPAVELRGEQGTYRLEIRSLATDIAGFREVIEDAGAVTDPRERSKILAAALDLWRGPFLADVDRVWVGAEASALEWERQRATAEWAESTIVAGHPSRVVPVLEREVSEKPTDEQLCALLMRGLYGSGRQTEALAAYRRLRDNLTLELGVEPGPEVRALEEQILLHVAAKEDAQTAWLLPSPPADLVGRSVEIEDLLARIEEIRLLTLTGPGGVGKTRLALELGRRIIDMGNQPVLFADLSTVFDEEAVDAVLASSANVQPHPDSGPLVSLIEYLRHRNAVLIIDNCEHLASAVARSLLALLRACPEISLIATSRAPLHIDGEFEWRTPSLGLPDRTDVSIDELRRWPAVELLLRRAPNSFPASDASPGDVVTLCRRLDGLPLALELAASRLGSMTPAEITAALESQARSSPGSSGVAHQPGMLDATIAWSHQLLDAGPRQLLGRLGVMSGRFSFEDVVSVCAPASVSAETVRGWLSGLVDQSLVMAETSGTRTRYRLLETIRHFAFAHLGEYEAEVRSRHARHYATLAEAEAPRLLTDEEGQAVAELSFAYDNLRSAMGWAMETGEVGVAAQIVASMPDWGYWRSRYELSRWAQWVWETTTPDHPRWRAVCGSAARGAWLGGRFDQAIRFGSAATETIGTVIARCAHPDDAVADVALYRGDANTALAHYSRVAAEATDSGAITRKIWATYYLAVINAVLGRSPEAVEAATKALAAARETGNPTALSFSLYANGLAVKHRSPSQAIAMFEEAVRMADSVGNDWFGGIARMELASTQTTHGDLGEGFRGFASVVDHWHRVGDDTQLRLTWRYLVKALSDVGCPQEAAMLAGALRADPGSVLTHPRPRLLAELAAVLGHAEYTRLTVRGSIMTVPELVVTSLGAIDRALHPSQGA